MTPGNITTLCSVIALATVLSACSSDNDSGSDNDDTVACNMLGASPYDEGNQLDISNDPAAPSAWSLGAGVNQLIAGTGGGDIDYISFTVGNCEQLDSIVVNAFSFNEGDDVAFIGMQQGSTFTVTPETAETRRNELLGYTLFGAATLSQDILPGMGQAVDAIGFTGPLSTGTYTLWLNQLGPESEYTLDFSVSQVSTNP